MSTAPVTLDSIRAAAEAKYGAYPITLDDGSVVKLQNPLRLSREDRAKLLTLQEELNAGEGEGKDVADVDQEAILSEMIRLVAHSPQRARQLLEEVNGDLAMLVEIMERYGKGVQVGEASASHD